jgi:hypothetical protein
MKALLIGQPWIDMILRGEKQWVATRPKILGSLNFSIGFGAMETSRYENCMSTGLSFTTRNLASTTQQMPKSNVLRRE